MLQVDIPTFPEFRALAAARSDLAISVYVPSTPQTQKAKAVQIEFANLFKEGLSQLEEADADKRSIAALKALADDLAADEEFWRFQANSLAVLMTPSSIRSFRLPNRIEANVEVSDRFHLKPLLRAITFPHEAFVLALAENEVRLIEVLSDMPAAEVKVKELPKSAADATGRSTVNDRSYSRRIGGGEGQKVLLRQYARAVDAALRAFLAGRETPLILAATEPLASIYAEVNTYPFLLARRIAASPADMNAARLSEEARPILDDHYKEEISAVRALYDTRAKDGRATTDISDAARAATFGAVDTLLVELDDVVHGRIDETSGAVDFAGKETAASYGVVNEIAVRAMAGGARVLSVRREDIPGEGALAAILRYAV